MNDPRFPRRSQHPVKNHFLAGAWSKPGHGYGAVIPGGIECSGEILKNQ